MKLLYDILQAGTILNLQPYSALTGNGSWGEGEDAFLKSKCSACGGELESRTITYTKEHNGQLVAIGGDPAKVCRRGDEEYFTPEVVDELHRIIQGKKWTKTLKVPYAQMQSSS